MRFPHLAKYFVAALMLIVANLFAEDSRPNIIWIFGEDMGPELGVYGDRNAITPNMDQLAREGIRFTHCYTTSPVCSPSRSGLITGQYPTTTGTHNHRSHLAMAPPIFIDYLKKAGYTIYWPTKARFGKTDFNFDVPANAFDVTSDWLRKKPQEPFFGFVNIGATHESKIRAKENEFLRLTSKLKPADRHDPQKLILPPYYPDAKEVREEVARYYDLVTAVDYRVGELLQIFKVWGIDSNTIVLVTGDHGSGLPRSKRWLYDSGVHVPLIVRLPKKIHAAEVRNDLVSFVDFAPTMLYLAGVPPWNQGNKIPIQGASCCEQLYPPMQGAVFLGPNAQKREYIFCSRDRIDERNDRIRSVRDQQFKYIRNFEPQIPYSGGRYGESMITMQIWRKWFEAGKLNDTQKLFFQASKPKEELYDCNQDPYEVKNLAEDSKYNSKLSRFRSLLDSWIKETKDLGEISEKELIQRGVLTTGKKEKDTDNE